jgi:hypothetical protein
MAPEPERADEIGAHDAASSSHDVRAGAWERLRDRHERTLWAPLTNIALGLWLLTSPSTFGYEVPAVIASDIASGLAVVIFGLLSLSPRLFWIRWAVCAVGIWLLFAPLVLWAPDPAAYTNNVLVGSLLIVFSVLVPGVPGLELVERPGPEVPPGWSYNPSSWLQRIPIITLGLVGFFISRYLAGYQLGYNAAAWDPVFGDGTQRVLESEISRAFPVSDAGLGAATYLLEVLIGSLGGSRRWRTMPWTVALFGVIVVPLGVTSLVLVILQPIGVGAWCTLCLVAAFAMLIMVPLAVDEVVAMGQFLARCRREGKSLWRVFWFGDTVEGGVDDTRSPQISAPASQTVPAMLWGVTVPWTLLASALLGAWVMLAPAAFGTTGWAANSNHLAGALIVTVAAVALAEVTRVVRFVNVLLGLWVIAAPWLLAGAVGLAVWNNLIVGVALIALSIPRRRIDERYGGWEQYIW